MNPVGLINYYPAKVRAAENIRHIINTVQILTTPAKSRLLNACEKGTGSQINSKALMSEKKFQN